LVVLFFASSDAIAAKYPDYETVEQDTNFLNWFQSIFGLSLPTLWCYLKNT